MTDAEQPELTDSPAAVRRDVGRLMRQYVSAVNSGQAPALERSNDESAVKALWEATARWWDRKGYSLSVEPPRSPDATAELDPQHNVVRVRPDPDSSLRLLGALHEAAHTKLPSADTAKELSGISRSRSPRR